MQMQGAQSWTGLLCAHLKLGSDCGFSVTDFGVGESSHTESHACWHGNLGWARSHCYFSHFQMSAFGVLRKGEKCEECGGPAGWKGRGVLSSAFQLLVKATPQDGLDKAFKNYAHQYYLFHLYLTAYEVTGKLKKPLSNNQDSKKSRALATWDVI